MKTLYLSLEFRLVFDRVKYLCDGPENTISSSNMCDSKQEVHEINILTLLMN